MDKIQAILDTYGQRATGHLGIGFMDLETGESRFLNGGHRFPSASTFKVPLLAALMARADAGEIDLDAPYTLRDTDIAPGSGVLCTLTPGLSLPVRDYAMLMMILSDNTATDILCRLVGLDRVRAQIEALGLPDTRADLPCTQLIYTLWGVPPGTPLAEALAGVEAGRYTGDNTLYTRFDVPNDFTSPRDMISLFSRIYRREILSPAACDAMMDIMAKCQTNSRIPYGLPRDFEGKVIHKTGTLKNVACDAGIVLGGRRPYALALYYNAHTATDVEKAIPHYNDLLLAGISGDIYAAVQG